MRLQPVESLSLTRPSMVEYFLFGIRLVHGLTAILPGLLLLFYLRDQHPETLTEVFKYRSMYQNPSDFTADKQTTRRAPVSPGSAVSFARPAWMNGSIWLDLYILLRTVAAVILTKEAF